MRGVKRRKKTDHDLHEYPQVALPEESTEKLDDAGTSVGLENIHVHEHPLLLLTDGCDPLRVER